MEQIFGLKVERELCVEIFSYLNENKKQREIRKERKEIEKRFWG